MGEMRFGSPENGSCVRFLHGVGRRIVLPGHFFHCLRVKFVQLIFVVLVVIAGCSSCRRRFLDDDRRLVSDIGQNIRGFLYCSTKSGLTVFPAFLDDLDRQSTTCGARPILSEVLLD
jgi:hypothetical protein